MNTFEIEVTMLLDGAIGETFTIEINESCNTLNDVIEFIIEDLNNLNSDDESWNPIDSLNESDFEINWGDTPQWCRDFDILEELMPEYENSHYDIDVFEAAHECDIPFSDVDEAYQGQYKDDDDFAYNTADQLGYLDERKSWPYNCIDWEQAARELMYDYSEANGHYFRNL